MYRIYQKKFIIYTKINYNQDKNIDYLENLKKFENKFIIAFEDFDFNEINKDNRKEKISKNLTENKNFIYGEITFSALIQIIKAINDIDNMFLTKKDKIFLDIGSGTGKVVIGFYFFSIFKKLIGVEIMENLYFKSELIKEKVQNLEENKVIDEINFFNCDIFDYNITDVDVIFANSTCWSNEFLIRLRNKFNNEGKKGLIIINTDQNIFNIEDNDNFDAINKKNLLENWSFYQNIRIDSNWGYSILYISKKIK